MMFIKRSFHSIETVFLAVVVFCSLFSCSKSDIPANLPVRENLIKQGRYLTARGVEDDIATISTGALFSFEQGTPYRIVCIAKPDPAGNDAGRFRFNKVAWEGISDGLHYINIADSPDKWFGFSPLQNESAGDNGLVQLDFYGLTYGKPSEHSSDYLALDGVEDDALPLTSIAEVKRTVHLAQDGALEDLLWGRLLEQSIGTVGANSPYGNSQSVMEYSHCFAKLKFLTVQQAKEDSYIDTEPVFGDLEVVSIAVIGTYSSAVVYLEDGLVGDFPPQATERVLDYPQGVPVSTFNKEVGEMHIFPSDMASLKSGRGYEVGLKVTFRSKQRATIDKFLANSGDGFTAEQNGDYWYGTVVKPFISNGYTDDILYFKRNTIYTLIISFQADAVRIITAIPQVEEWLQGEDSDGSPWLDQALGRPQMFDNVIWSDRNIGASHFNPYAYFDESIGYFFQAGRNIPYYPFHRDKYINELKRNPLPSDKLYYADESMMLSAFGSAESSPFFFYPIADRDILKMDKSSQNWILNDNETPQMYIPEMNDSAIGDFGYMANIPDMFNQHWEENQANQPESGIWQIPTAAQLRAIFPTTPFAGNITFRSGGNSSTPLAWCANSPSERSIPDGVRLLRVTVPFYSAESGLSAPLYTDDAKYMEAWNTLADNSDPGTSDGDNRNVYRYYTGKGFRKTYYTPYYNRIHDPKGDPDEGYATAYIISREDGDETALPASVSVSDYIVRYWGTIYAIKRIYTPRAYRMRWRVIMSNDHRTADVPAMFIEISRYDCSSSDGLTADNFKSYDWDNPSARIFLPITGYADAVSLRYINYGTECDYASSAPISDGKTTALHIKITGDHYDNSYIAVVEQIPRNNAKQIRPVRVGLNVQ